MTPAPARGPAVLTSPGRDGDRRDAGHPERMGVALEPRRAGGLSDQDRSSRRPASCLGEQLRTMDLNEIAKLALERSRCART